MSRLTSYLLNLVYLTLLLAALPWVVWGMATKGKYREGYAAKLLGCVPRRAGQGACVWLHAVSVGEVNVLRTLVEELASRRPDIEIVISTTTKTGFDLAKKRFAEYCVFYCPLDFSWAVRAAMRRIRPSALVLAELELWPNLIQAAKESGATAAIVNGRLSDNSFRGYRRIRPLVATVLRKIDLIAAQDETTAERFRELGAQIESVHVSGSLKYDGAETDRDNERTRTLRTLASIKQDDIIFLAGSTQEPEETVALSAFQQLVETHPRLKLVLVPRHPERFDEVARLLDDNGTPWWRRSDCKLQNRNCKMQSVENAAMPDHHKSTARVLLVDTVGELGAWWGMAGIGFVGGSLGSRGGQNMIEPAAYGVATSFGPNTRNFRDIVAALLAVDGAVVVQNGDELAAFVGRCLEEPDWANSLGERASRFVQTQLGATTRTVELLSRILKSNHQGTKTTKNG